MGQRSHPAEGRRRSPGTPPPFQPISPGWRHVTADDQHRVLADAWQRVYKVMDSLPQLLVWDGTQYIDVTDMADRVRGIALHLDSAVGLSAELRYASALAILRTGLEQCVVDW